MGMIWSPQQARALDSVQKWLRDPHNDLFYLAGYAGTGKTTLAKHLVEGVDGVCLQAAYTGKAASVLRKKGFPHASTLHSLMYKVYDPDRTVLLELQESVKALEEEAAGYAPEEPPKKLSRALREARERASEEKARLKGPHFGLNPDSPLHGAKLLLVDEVSMVDNPLGEDLRRFGIKILVLGDPAQLPPVKGAGYFTNRRPDQTLTEIHRQAAESPIIRWSMAVREGKELPFKVEGEARKLSKAEVTARDLLGAGQILTGKNETRRNINRKLRRLMGHSDLYPVRGDKLVCLRNDHDVGVLNGVVCEAAQDTYHDPDGWMMLEINYEDRPEPLMLEIDPLPFRVYQNPELEEDMGFNRSVLQFDYGYALTVHKSQGSQWDDVWIADDGFAKWQRDLRKKWMYTAITRAERTLTIVSD